MSPPEFDVDAVCFDLDETLAVSELSDHEFHNTVFERAGVDPLFSPADLRAVDVADLPPAENITEFYANLYRETLSRVDAAVNPESSLVDELSDIAGGLSEETGVVFRDGAREAFEHVRDRYDLALVTNGKQETQLEKLKALGVWDAFDAAVFREPDTSIDGKPATEPFEIVLSELSVSPERAVFVGDSHGEDIVGAHRAGLHSVWTPMNYEHEELPEDPEPAPTYRTDVMHELTTLL